MNEEKEELLKNKITNAITSSVVEIAKINGDSFKPDTFQANFKRDEIINHGRATKVEFIAQPKFHEVKGKKEDASITELAKNSYNNLRERPDRNAIIEAIEKLETKLIKHSDSRPAKIDTIIRGNERHILSIHSSKHGNALPNIQEIGKVVNAAMKDLAEEYNNPEFTKNLIDEKLLEFLRSS